MKLVLGGFPEHIHIVMDVLDRFGGMHDLSHGIHRTVKHALVFHTQLIVIELQTDLQQFSFRPFQFVIGLASSPRAFREIPEVHDQSFPVRMPGIQRQVMEIQGPVQHHVHLIPDDGWCDRGVLIQVCPHIGGSAVRPAESFLKPCGEAVDEGCE